jgi:hypothetical protein
MKLALRVVAVLLFLTGIVWALQGANVLPGSFMTGQVEWLAAGIACLLAGAGLWVLAARLAR